MTRFGPAPTASELTEDLSSIHRALRAGGTVRRQLQGRRDRFGRHYNYPDAETLRPHYGAAAGWTNLLLESVMGSGYDNQPTEWLWVTARK